MPSASASACETRSDPCAPRRRHEEATMLAIWVKVRVRPQLRQRFLEAIEVDALGSERDEPGCLRFNVLQDEHDENVYYFYEVYKDQAALEAHRAMPHYAVWRAAADARDAPSEPTRCRSPPADSTRCSPATSTAISRPGRGRASSPRRAGWPRPWSWWTQHSATTCGRRRCRPGSSATARATPSTSGTSLPRSSRPSSAAAGRSTRAAGSSSSWREASRTLRPAVGYHPTTTQLSREAPPCRETAIRTPGSFPPA